MMYLSFYNLTEKPFQISTDPKFLWLGEKHREALASLKYGVLDNKGFLLMTGDVGTGKTTLINALIKQLGQEIICARVPDPGLSLIDFYNFIADAYQMGAAFSSKGPFLIQFGKFLNNAFARNKKVLLIVDEAQRLPDDLLEEVRVLSNILAHGQQINIFFVGQNEFNDSLLRVENRALRNRITITYNIEPLTEEETRQYIQNRLSVAGSQKEIFLPDAIQQISAFSDGNPRRINILCDLALLTGYVQEAPQINAAIIAECAQEVSIPMLTVVNNSEPTAKNTANKP
ncbi:MAG: AAA family ATPase, partial [Desulfobacterales bacterium]|nr:AAA family ATPase [Desulfobacterales bacterium]